MGQEPFLDRENVVGPIAVTTDADGIYMFIDLRPGIYVMAETQPDAAIALADLARQYEAGLREPPPPRRNATLPPEEQEALRDLGYIE